MFYIKDEDKFIMVNINNSGIDLLPFRSSCCLIREKLWPGCCGGKPKNPVGGFWVKWHFFFNIDLKMEIHLLNTESKVLAKVLAQRLEGVLPSIISSDQTGFIKNR